MICIIRQIPIHTTHTLLGKTPKSILALCKSGNRLKSTSILTQKRIREIRKYNKSKGEESL